MLKTTTRTKVVYITYLHVCMIQNTTIRVDIVISDYSESKLIETLVLIVAHDQQYVGPLAALSVQ